MFLCFYVFFECKKRFKFTYKSTYLHIYRTSIHRTSIYKTIYLPGVTIITVLILAIVVAKLNTQLTQFSIVLLENPIILSL